MISQHASEHSPSPSVPAERREISVRRAPKFVPFLIAGALLGVLAAALVALTGAGNDSYDRSTVFGFFAVVLAVPGMLLGGTAALVLDKVSVKRTKRAIVEQVPDEPDEATDEPASGTGGPAFGTDEPASGTGEPAFNEPASHAAEGAAEGPGQEH